VVGEDQRKIYYIAPCAIIKDNLVYHTTSAGCHLFEIGKGFKVKEKILQGQPEEPQKQPRRTSSWSASTFTVTRKAAAGRARNLRPASWPESPLSRTVRPAARRSAPAGCCTSIATGRARPGQANKDLEVISSFKLPALSKYPKSRTTSRYSAVWSYPAIANGYLYLRDAELIYCYDIRDKK